MAVGTTIARITRMIPFILIGELLRLGPPLETNHFISGLGGICK
jgi:hypothetical protein